MKEVTKNIISAFKASSVRVKFVVGVAAAVLLTSTLCEALNVKFAYKITYNDETVGYVSSAEQLSDVENNVLSGIKVDDAKSYLRDSNATLSITLGSKIGTSSAVARDILDADIRLVRASVLSVDGTVVCALKGDKDRLEGALNARLAQFSDADVTSAEFVGDVAIEEGYFPRSLVSSMTQVEEELENIGVKTVKTITYTEDIPFETITTESSSHLKGYKKVTSKGVLGSQNVTAVVTCVNGLETERNVIESVVVTEPVAQQMLVGTAKASKISSTNKASGKAMFIWPVKKVAGQVISSYYGDGRNHRAIDIATAKGTPIYAALGGTVTFSGYAKDYGYYIIINHGNGFETLYSHASKLLASEGQVVNTGDTIALVGSTGRSTGNHLHFEVRINGNRVNPLNYTKR